jgi:hypothetical protein
VDTHAECHTEQQGVLMKLQLKPYNTAIEHLDLPRDHRARAGLAVHGRIATAFLPPVKTKAMGLRVAD